MRVLVVDNDVQIRSLLARAMQYLGFNEVLQAGDGLAALSILAQSEVDLILTDLQMPRLDGLGLVRHLRSAGDRTPVLMLSGVDEPQVIETARRSGVNRFLSKPVNLDHLAGAVRKTLPAKRRIANDKPLSKREIISKTRKRKSA